MKLISFTPLLFIIIITRRRSLFIYKLVKMQFARFSTFYGSCINEPTVSKRRSLKIEMENENLKHVVEFFLECHVGEGKREARRFI